MLITSFSVAPSAFSSMGLSVVIVSDFSHIFFLCILHGEKNQVYRGHFRIQLLRTNISKIESQHFKGNRIVRF